MNKNRPNHPHQQPTASNSANVIFVALESDEIGRVALRHLGIFGPTRLIGRWCRVAEISRRVTIIPVRCVEANLDNLCAPPVRKVSRDEVLQ